MSVKKAEPWPPIRPFKDGYFPVSRIHAVHYALYGNPKGEPVFFLHGGPGGGCTDEDARWFDPEKYLIVLHDQRGAGKSTPLAEIKENTTQLLIDDIENLREYLKIKFPLSFFAGSWGSTLALLYAEAFPANVSRMILRGIFTCTYAEQDYFYSANGAARFHPEAWEKLVDRIPPAEGRIQDQIHRLIENPDEEKRIKWCRILAEYEYSFFDIPSGELEKELSKSDTIYPEMRLNMYYQSNRFFIDDKQIFRNIGSIKHIPVTIVNGSNDLICPPASAVNLHKYLPESRLILVPGAGHLSSDPGIKKALLEATSDWE